MLHSSKIMQSMIARRPSEEDVDTKPVAQSAPQPQQEAAPAQERPLEPYMDHAEPVLRKHGVDSDTAASLWDDFHNARTSADLTKALEKYPDLNAAVKHDLFVEKQKNDPAPTWHDKLDRVIEVINKHLPNLHETSSARGGKSSITTADRHPNVLRAFLDAQKKEGGDE
jgi:hypothetical protein